MPCMAGTSIMYPAVACYEEMGTPRSDFRNRIPRPTFPSRCTPIPKKQNDKHSERRPQSRNVLPHSTQNAANCKAGPLLERAASKANENAKMTVEALRSPASEWNLLAAPQFSTDQNRGLPLY